MRFGDTTSALFNVSMTQTSDGAVDSATDSYNPMGGFGPLTGMMLGEVTPGGRAAGCTRSSSTPSSPCSSAA